MLEDDDICERIQIIMLIDEDVLQHAITLKFKPFIDSFEGSSRSDRADFARSDVVNEHIEKLFACHLRLPSLNSAEIGDIARRYSQADLLRRGAAATLKSSTQDTISARAPANSSSAAKEPPVSSIPADAAEPTQLMGSDLRFSEDEVNMLASQLAPYMKRGGRRPSPRGIRTFLFKYQLCRLLMQLSHDAAGYSPDESKPQSILDALAIACFDGQQPVNKEEHGGRATLRCVVAQVV